MAGDLSYMYNTDAAIGSLSNILYSKGLCFCGAEVDMSIRPGWFYHPEEEPHSLERLMKTYMTSVGGNACFHLNIPPMPNGKFDERDVQRLKERARRSRRPLARSSAPALPWSGRPPKRAIPSAPLCSPWPGNKRRAMWNSWRISSTRASGWRAS